MKIKFFKIFFPLGLLLIVFILTDFWLHSDPENPKSPSRKEIAIIWESSTDRNAAYINTALPSPEEKDKLQEENASVKDSENDNSQQEKTVSKESGSRENISDQPGDKEEEVLEEKYRKPGEKVLRFASVADFRAFLKKAGLMGFPVLDYSEQLLMILIKTDDSIDWHSLLEEYPPEEEEFNYYVYSPEIPPEVSPAWNRAYKPFMNSAGEWMGLDKDRTGNGTGVLVAVLDTGIMPHRSLDESRIIHTDTTDSSSTGDGRFAYHGTAVASIIGGKDTYINGIAPDVQFLEKRVLDDNGVGDSVTLAMGIIEAVDQGADIINLSLGGLVDSSVLYEAVRYAYDKGTVIIASAGNSGELGITYPARYDEVLAVGAIDAYEERLPFSSQGEGLDIMAPGYGLLAAMGDDLYDKFSGTSGAAATISGMVAVMLSEDPYLSPIEALNILISEANDLGAPGWDSSFGYGFTSNPSEDLQFESGDKDIAAADYYLPEPTLPQDGSDVPVLLTVQNRGEVEAKDIIVYIELPGETLMRTIDRLAPGESQAVPFGLNQDDLKSKKIIMVDATVEVRGEQDVDLSNNDRNVDFELIVPDEENPHN